MLHQSIRRILGARLTTFAARLQSSSAGGSNNNNKKDEPKTPEKNDDSTPNQTQNANATPSKEPYRVPYNYNFEEFKNYKRKVEEVIEENKKRENIEDPLLRLPRRQRRIYDKPKFDLDIKNYGAWRIFDRDFIKRGPDAEAVLCKISATPKQLIRAFGQPIPVKDNQFKETTKVYKFEDDNHDMFLIYDYKATTLYWGPDDPTYDYDNQDNIAPRFRKKRHLSLQEFWNSDTLHDFRVNATPEADFRKFQVWAYKQIKDSEEPGQSWEERANRAFPKFETYDDYKKEYPIDFKPSVFEFDKTFWLQKGEKIDPKVAAVNPYYDKIKPAKKLDEKYRIKQK